MFHTGEENWWILSPPPPPIRCVQIQNPVLYLLPQGEQEDYTLTMVLAEMLLVCEFWSNRSLRCWATWSPRNITLLSPHAHPVRPSYIHTSLWTQPPFLSLFLNTWSTPKEEEESSPGLDSVKKWWGLVLHQRLLGITNLEQCHPPRTVLLPVDDWTGYPWQRLANLHLPARWKKFKDYTAAAWSASTVTAK